jgi:branched-chain amino acid transport system ATP-binding protein
LEVESLAKHFGGVPAVNGVSFRIDDGEILGVIGPNGSGKSTLFNCILGQIKPDAGRVRVDGHDVTGLRPDRLNRRGVSRTFQLLQIFPGMAVRENLIAAGQEHKGSMVSRLFGAAEAEQGEQADLMLDFFRLGALANIRAGELSYGQQKMLDIAMAFMSGARMILLDEPAGGVNPAVLSELSGRLREMNRMFGATFAIIEHNMDFVTALCSRVIVLAEGRILAEGRPEEVCRDAQVIEAYLGN